MAIDARQERDLRPSSRSLVKALTKIQLRIVDLFPSIMHNTFRENCIPNVINVSICKIILNKQYNNLA